LGEGDNYGKAGARFHHLAGVDYKKPQKGRPWEERGATPACLRGGSKLRSHGLKKNSAVLKTSDEGTRGREL